MKKAFVAMALVLCVSSALAATVYNNQADFLANVAAGYYLEDFGTPATSYVVTAPFTNGTYTWSVSAGDDIYVWGEDYASGTPCVGSLGTNGPGYAMTFTFSGAPVTAFGGNLYLTDQYFGAVSGTAVVSLNDGTQVTLTNPYSTTFTGFTSTTPITSVTLTPDPGSTVNLYGTVDNIICGAYIPEPSALVLLGLGAMALIRRR